MRRIAAGTTGAASAKSAGARGPSFGLALAVVAVTFCAYVLFNYYRLGDDLFAWSKTLASFDYRQHLGMSKRWALQYGHMAFLFVLLVMAKYIFVSGARGSRRSKLIATIVPYTLPIFLFHFPLLYFFTALTEHDPTDPIDQLVLFLLVLLTCIAFAQVCFLAKPLFDRLQVRAVAWCGPRCAKVGKRPPQALTMSHEFSDFLRLMRLLATLSIFLGHFTFTQFSSLELPGFDHWRRWAVPFFFMISGYFAMLVLARSEAGALSHTVDRFLGLWFVVVPVLIAVPILDLVGYCADPELYALHEKYVEPGAGLPLNSWSVVTTAFNSLFYLNEIFLYDLLGSGTVLGGMRTFSNDPFWFLCYIMPFTAMLAIMIRVAGWRKYLWLGLLGVLFGPPILFLAPLFFSGCLAYLIHKKV